VKKKLINLKNAVLVVGGLVLGAGSAYFVASQEIPPETPVAVLPEVVPVVPTVEELYPYEIPPNSTLNSVLRELEVSPQIIHQIVEAAKPVSNLGRLKPGVRFQLTFSPGSETEVVGIRFRFSPVEMLEVKKVNDQWVPEKITENVETRIMTFSGVVTSSLWESAAEAKMDPVLISDLAEVFAWQVDFSREVRPQDRWRISVEQKLVKGEPIGWGSILAAEYENAGQKYAGILFRPANEAEGGYYAPDGTSLRRLFLKSPIRYGRISSRFTMRRFHPVLKYNRPHLGVDYAAPIGTPIRAVGDGTVETAGYRGGAGNMIKLRHNSVYATAYKHLKGFARGVRSGARVRQGQIIGYVGNSGLSTGPHLHFEFFQGGRYVDPMGRKFPSADPVPAKLMAQFKTEMSHQLATLPPWTREIQVGKSANIPKQND